MIKQGILLLFLNIFCLTYANSYHPFFVTITEIEHNSTSKTVEISIKIFTDDLEKALNHRFGGKASLNTSQENQQVNTALKTYFSEHFGLSINGDAQSCTFIGKEKEDDATWCYLEVNNVPNVVSVNVKNSILTELYESQNNIVHVKVRGTSKSLMLKRNAPAGTVSF